MNTDQIYRVQIRVADPAMLINANHRTHWRAKAKKTAHWREVGHVAGMAALRNGLLVPMERAHLTAWFSWPDARRRDVGNLAPTIKGLVDGLVDAGVLPDDDDKHLLGPDLRRDPEKRAVGIRLEFRELEGTK